jgi:hypothetical protein
MHIVLANRMLVDTIRSSKSRLSYQLREGACDRTGDLSAIELLEDVVVSIINNK